MAWESVVLMMYPVLSFDGVMLVICLYCGHCARCLMMVFELIVFGLGTLCVSKKNLLLCCVCDDRAELGGGKRVG